MYVRDILPSTPKQIPTVEADSMVVEALKRLAHFDCGAILVTDKTKFVGLLSERDCVRKIEIAGRSPYETRVREIMVSEVVCVSPDTTIERCLEIFGQHHIRHLPVLSAKGELVGFVSVLDVVKSLIREKSEIIQKLENYVSSTWPF